MTTIGSLFSGYSGLDMAIEAVTGGRTIWRSDIDPGANKIIAHHWPDEPNLGDITAIDWLAVERPDILTLGFPCQDVSAAGKRTGLIRYGDARNRSGLWAMAAKAIDEIRPDLVVIENVRGLLSAKADAHPDVFDCLACMADTNDKPMRALGAVLGDLAALGFDAEWCGVRASDIGAPHQRFRVFVIAWLADADRAGLAQWCQQPAWDERATTQRGGADAVALITDLLPTPSRADGAGGPGHSGRAGGLNLRTAVDLLPTPDAGVAGGRTRSAEALARGNRQVSLHDLPRINFGKFAAAVDRWAQLTRPAPEPTETGPRGGQRLSPAFVEWMMGLPAGHVTSPNIGLSRNEQLKALGNGVVPQQAEAALRLLLNAMAAAA